MIYEIRLAIINRLMEVFPTGYAIYDQSAPQSVQQPYFLITLVKQSYNKRISNIYTTQLFFDVAFVSDKEEIDIITDCQRVQEDLLRAFDFIDTYKVFNKEAQITDNILHITFDIRYSEMKDELSVSMQQQQTNTNL